MLNDNNISNIIELAYELARHLDALIDKAEKPAEKAEADPIKEREGDDVLRRWMRLAERQHLLGDWATAALHELVRRSLEEKR